jgi:hypothetical protein
MWRDTGVVLFFATWLILTIYKNVPGTWRRLSLINRLTGSWFVPSWTFFAPTPGTKSYHILYRDLGIDGFSEWRHLPVAEARRKRRFLWNPEKTSSKALVDIANEFSAIVSSLDEAERRATPRRLQVTLPYLILLSYVSALPRLQPVVATQFALGQTGPSDSTLLLLSAVHRLPVGARHDA